MSSLCFWHVEHPEFLPLGLEHQIYFGRNQIISEISFRNQFLETIPNGEYPVSWFLEQHFSNRTFLENLPFSNPMIYMIYRWWVSSSVTKKQASDCPLTCHQELIPWIALQCPSQETLNPITNPIKPPFSYGFPMVFLWPLNGGFPLQIPKVSNVSNEDSNVSSGTNHIGPGWSKESCSLFRHLGDGDMFGCQGFLYIFKWPIPKDMV